MCYLKCYFILSWSLPLFQGVLVTSPLPYSGIKIPVVTLSMGYKTKVGIMMLSSIPNGVLNLVDLFLVFVVAFFQFDMYRPVSPLQEDSVSQDFELEEFVDQRTCLVEVNQTLITDFFPVVQNGVSCYFYKEKLHPIGSSFHSFVPGVKKLVSAHPKSNNQT